LLGWGGGVGVLGVGARPQTPNPQTPIPNPQSPILNVDENMKINKLNFFLYIKQVYFIILFYIIN